MDTSGSSMILLLAVITIALYIIPFIPAIVEWRRKTDAEPLSMRYRDETVVAYNLRLFREFISNNFSGILSKHEHDNTDVSSVTEKGTEYFITGKSGPVTLPSAVIKNGRIGAVILATKGITLPENMMFDNKVYSKGNLNIGSSTSLIDVYSEGNLTLNENSRVENLLYCDGSLTVDHGCNLVRYAQVKNTIQINGEIVFHYLHALRIFFGEAGTVLNKSMPKTCADIFSKSIKRKVIEKNYTIEKGMTELDNLVVNGNLFIEEGAKVMGSIKAHHAIHIGNNVTVAGTIFCDEDISIGNNCVIQGPVVSERNITIGENCIFGSVDTKTCVIGKVVTVHTGCVFTGLLFAKVEGLFKLQN